MSAVYRFFSILIQIILWNRLADLHCDNIKLGKYAKFGSYNLKIKKNGVKDFLCIAYAHRLQKKKIK